jgi:DNA ligase D-like protein (predicted 3'-phosphoesterase)
MATKNKLSTYRKRRDLDKSPEPKGTIKKKKGKALAFVIHKHAASHLHYDLRLEIDGVLVSWAIPKGPSTNSSVKRLGIRTDDHPFEYKNFEGIIPEGSYGAGTVMIWDRGTYCNTKTDNDGNLVSLSTCLRSGQLEFSLNGKKLQGGYAMIKTKIGWLFIKMKDKHANARRNPVNTENKSVKSERTMNEIKKAAIKTKK